MATEAVGMSSKRYTDEFKIEAVKQVTERGHSVADVAQRLGITTHSLYAWKAKFDRPDVVRQAELDEQIEARALSSMYAMAETRFARPQSERERKIASWPQKVAIESASFPLQRPVIDPTLFASVSYALFEERKLDIGYRARHNGGLEKSQVIWPLGLVEVGTLVYLISQRDTRPEPFMYRLDRIVRADVLLESFRYPTSFSLDQYVRTQRSFDFLVEKEIALDLKFTHHAGHHLLESPFAPDQTHEQQDDFLRVRGTVMLSQRLRWWLRSFGPHVEVLAPQSLREELAAEARELAGIYCESCSSVA
jgi:predicted DNA-binding transcriptional regulator YafY